MANKNGIAIIIKAFLPVGKTIDEQFAALTLVKSAHESGDYSELLKAATVDEVKTEQKTRRVEDTPQQTQTQEQPSGDGEAGEPAPTTGTGDGGEQPSDATQADEPQTEAAKAQVKRNAAKAA